MGEFWRALDTISVSIVFSFPFFFSFFVEITTQQLALGKNLPCLAMVMMTASRWQLQQLREQTSPPGGAQYLESRDSRGTNLFSGKDEF